MPSLDSANDDRLVQGELEIVYKVSVKVSDIVKTHMLIDSYSQFLCAERKK